MTILKAIRIKIKINLVYIENSLIFALSIKNIIMSKTKEILKAHGLDFRIEKRQLFGTDEEGGQLITPYFGLFNTKSGECINTCKVGYHVSQNEDIVDMVLEGTAKFGNQLSVSKAGSINGGRRVFLQLAIEGKTKVAGDNITRYITIIDSNDGSTSLSVGIGDKNMWCGNQFFKFYKAGEAKFRHTATLEQKIASIPSLIETALSKSIKQIETYNKFISTPLTKGLADKLVKEILGYDKLITSKTEIENLSGRQVRIMDELYADIDTEIAHSGKNLWSLFGGVTRYTTYHQSVPKRINGREESLINGTGYNKAIKAFEFLLEQV